MNGNQTLAFKTLVKLEAEWVEPIIFTSRYNFPVST